MLHRLCRKLYLSVLIDNLFALQICRVTNRVHITWTQTGCHSILNWTFNSRDVPYHSSQCGTECDIVCKLFVVSVRCQTGIRWYATL